MKLRKGPHSGTRRGRKAFHNAMHTPRVRRLRGRCRTIGVLLDALPAVPRRPISCWRRPADPGPARASDHRILIDALTWPELQDRTSESGEDDGHHPDRCHRAERPAHGRSASTTSECKALSVEGRASARQRAGGAGRRRTSPREASTRRRRTCAFPAPSPCPTPCSRRCIESAARSFRLHGFRDIVLSRRPRRPIRRT